MSSRDCLLRESESKVNAVEIESQQINRLRKLFEKELSKCKELDDVEVTLKTRGRGKREKKKCGI